MRDFNFLLLRSESLLRMCQRFLGLAVRVFMKAFALPNPTFLSGGVCEGVVCGAWLLDRFTGQRRLLQTSPESSALRSCMPPAHQLKPIRLTENEIQTIQALGPKFGPQLRPRPSSAISQPRRELPTVPCKNELLAKNRRLFYQKDDFSQNLTTAQFAPRQDPTPTRIR